MSIILPPNICIYCSKEVGKVKKGAHVIPAFLGVKPTLGKQVCTDCNCGILSTLDEQLRQHSPLALPVGTQLDSKRIDKFWQTIDENERKLEIESSLAADLTSSNVWPQLILLDNNETWLVFGKDYADHGDDVEFRNDFYQKLEDRATNGKKGVMYEDMSASQRPLNYPPRVFAAKKPEDFHKVKTFQCRYASEAGKQRIKKFIENFNAKDMPPSSAEISIPTGKGSMVLQSDFGLVIRSLLKIAINVTAHSLKSEFDRDSFKKVIDLIMGRTPIRRKHFDCAGFVRVNSFAHLQCDQNEHRVRIEFLNNNTICMFSFFGMVDAIAVLPKHKELKTSSIDIVAPLKEKEWRIKKNSFLVPAVKARPFWGEFGEILGAENYNLTNRKWEIGGSS